MGHKLLVIQAAALSHDFDIEGMTSHDAQSVFPALTCTVQASFRTASQPSRHGMIANGLFFRNLNRPMFWEQSAGLVQGKRIWEDFRSAGKRVALLFWQQSLGESVDVLLSPAPIHKHHGGMIQGCYAKPTDLYERLCRRIGRPFRLRHYWGPLASRKVSDWIVAATKAVLEDPELTPDLCFTYLPTLDYDLQRHDPENSPAGTLARSKLEEQLSGLVQAARNLGYEVLIFGDYHIAPVKGAAYPNLELCKAGLMKTRTVEGMLYPDFYESRAFALVDHEIAHIFISNLKDMNDVKHCLTDLPGVGEILDRGAQMEVGVNHPSSGELLLVAEKGKWFSYPWWTGTRQAPDFAGHVDIHNKPGYDPCELFFGWPPGSVSRNTQRIKGSHGRTGPGREISWAASFSMPDRPTNLLDLSKAVKSWLDERR